VRRIYLLLVGVMALALAYAGPAMAHPLGFESDLSENGHIEVCNPNDVIPNRVQDGMTGWNLSHDEARPIFNNIEGFPGIPCELKVVRKSGDGIPGPGGYLGRCEFSTHPDQMQIFDGFFGLSEREKDHTVFHELGHCGVGLAHNGRCDDSVMPTTSYCSNHNESVRATPGPHDISDLTAYWNGPSPRYPIPNKCWKSVATDDANHDGVCDHSGPPGDGLSAQGVGPDPVPVPEDGENDSVVFVRDPA
jgi:hypothetical protein